jgi:hypothetical protein
MNHFFKKVHIRNIRCKGFVLPFTMLIATLVLFITTGALAILSKQQYFSRIYKQTQAAYYAADDAVACATSLDDTYVGQDGIGIFPVASTTDKDEYINGVLQYVSTKRDLAVTLTQADVKCGQSPIFVPGGTPSFNPGFSIVDDSFVYHFTNPVTGLPDREYGVTSSSCCGRSP